MSASITAAQQLLPSTLDALATDYFNISITRYVAVAGGCMAVYDHILSFPDEVEVIWKAPFSVVNAIYVFNRVSLPIILALHQYDYGGLGPVSEGWCKTWLAFEAVWTFCCLIAIHWLMTIRVWVFTGRKPSIFRWLVSAYVICALLTIGVVSAGMVFMVPASHPSTAIPICSNILPSFMLGIWFPFAFLEIGMFVMTIRTYREHAAQKAGLSSATPLLDTLWRDGFIYFIVIMSSGIFNVVVWAAAPGGLKLLARHFTFACSVVASSHLVLSIRLLGRQLQQLDSLTITGLPTGIDGRSDWVKTEIDWARTRSSAPGGQWTLMDRPDEREDDDEENRYDIELVGSTGLPHQKEVGASGGIVGRDLAGDLEVSTPTSSRPLMIHPASP